MFSFLRPRLEKLGCECYFASSCQEITQLLAHIELHIVLSLNTYQNLPEMMRLLAGHSVNMFHLVPVETGCWWLPVLRNGEECLGLSAISTKEFTHIFAEMVLDMNIKATSKGAMRFEALKVR